MGAERHTKAAFTTCSSATTSVARMLMEAMVVPFANNLSAMKSRNSRSRSWKILKRIAPFVTTTSWTRAQSSRRSRLQFARASIMVTRRSSCHVVPSLGLQVALSLAMFPKPIPCTGDGSRSLVGSPPRSRVRFLSSSTSRCPTTPSRHQPRQTLPLHCQGSGLPQEKGYLVGQERERDGSATWIGGFHLPLGQRSFVDLHSNVAADVNSS